MSQTEWAKWTTELFEQQGFPPSEKEEEMIFPWCVSSTTFATSIPTIYSAKIVAKAMREHAETLNKTSRRLVWLTAALVLVTAGLIFQDQIRSWIWPSSENIQKVMLIRK